MELDSRVRAVAMEVNDFNLLGKLSAGDMVTLKSRYHKQCLVATARREPGRGINAAKSSLF